MKRTKVRGAIAVVIMAAATIGYGDSISLEPNWAPPEWLSGYWSDADGAVSVAAEPGYVDVMVEGDSAIVWYTIQDWSDERGDVFMVDIFPNDGESERIEWETAVREYRDAGLTWVAAAINDDGLSVVSLLFHYVDAETVMLLLTVGENQASMSLRRDE